MLLDLREIIGSPGRRAAFQYAPDLSDAVSGSVVLIKQPSNVSGEVVNRAGVLELNAELDAECVCVCARCLREFTYPVRQRITACIADEGETGEDTESYLLQGDKADIGEIIRTEFILNLDDTRLCREDCAGLCRGCGADLNEGPCACEAETDPRLAVLGSLLEN